MLTVELRQDQPTVSQICIKIHCALFNYLLHAVWISRIILNDTVWYSILRVFTVLVHWKKVNPFQRSHRSRTFSGLSGSLCYFPEMGPDTACHGHGIREARSLETVCVFELGLVQSHGHPLLEPQKHRQLRTEKHVASEFMDCDL